MERIQYAIAKARAERDARGEALAPAETAQAETAPAETAPANPAQADTAVAERPAPAAPANDTAQAARLLARSPQGGAPAAVPAVPEPAPSTQGPAAEPRAPEPARAAPAVQAPTPEPEPEPEGPSEAEIAAAWRALPTLRTTNRLALRNRLVALSGRSGAADVDGIRTRLLQHLAAKGARRVAITSPGPGCGKSTVALNLGFSLGRQGDQRTLVADVDLRRPHMHKALGIRDKHSFAAVLAGEGRLADNALRHGANLAFAVNHAPARNPAELLQSRRAARTLEEIEAAYAPTVMLFDLPPLLVNDDAMAFLGKVDCALIVAAAERTTIKEIDRCEREVASQTSVLGVILNRCRYMDKADGYADYYGKYG
jgi:Mrp family chromosome partitioning ATPase